MKLLLCLPLLAALTCAAVVPEFQLPEGVMTCSQDDPDLNDCIKTAIQDMLPKLFKGSKALNIPPIDPFVIEKSHVSYDNGVVQGQVSLNSIKVYGLSRAEIKKVNTTISDTGLRSAMTVFIPRVFIEGSFKGSVKLNNLKLNPKGIFNVTMNDVDVIHKVAGNFETTDGVRYLRLTEYDMDPEVGNMKFYASRLFENPQLDEIALNFINEYWPVVYKVLLPETRPTWEPIMIEAANRFLLHVPFDKLLTKSN